jgi:hypothetical protein
MSAIERRGRAARRSLPLVRNRSQGSTYGYTPGPSRCWSTVRPQAPYFYPSRAAWSPATPTHRRTARERDRGSGRAARIPSACGTRHSGPGPSVTAGGQKGDVTVRMAPTGAPPDTRAALVGTSTCSPASSASIGRSSEAGRGGITAASFPRAIVTERPGRSSRVALARAARAKVTIVARSVRGATLALVSATVACQPTSRCYDGSPSSRRRAFVGLARRGCAVVVRGSCWLVTMNE